MAFRTRVYWLLATYLVAMAVLFGPVVTDVLMAESLLGKLPVKPQLSHEQRILYVRNMVLGTVTVRVHPYHPRYGMGEGFGTGAIFTEDGYILTAAHVVDSNEFVHVTFHRLDGMATGLDDLREEPADVLAVDTTRDMAIIKLRHPERVRLTTFAIDPDGSPPEKARFWFIGTRSLVEPGVVTDVEKTIPLGDENAPGAPPLIMKKVTVARTSATQGDSGGPVLDANGTIVGILIGSDSVSTGIISPLKHGFTELLAKAQARSKELKTKTP